MYQPGTMIIYFKILTTKQGACVCINIHTHSQVLTIQRKALLIINGLSSDIALG